MSDNVSQLHAQKHPGLGKRIAVFALLLVLVTGGVAAYVFRDRLNLDALQRYVRYLNVSEDSKTGRDVACTTSGRIFCCVGTYFIS